MNDLTGLAILVVNYGSSELLESNLAPLTTAHPELRTVIVDNFSSADEQTTLAALCRRFGWTAVLQDENVGFGVGMNTAAEVAIADGADALMPLNPDAVIDSDSAAILLRAVRNEPLTMVAPTVYRPDGSVWSAGSDLYLDDGRIRSVRRRIPGARIRTWLSGACLVLSADLWQRTGGFDAEYFLYWEDVDLSWRVEEAGGSLRIEPGAKAVHAEGGTQGGGGHSSAGAPKSSVYYYYNIRNRLLFAAHHLPPDDLARWRRSALKVAYEVLLQGGRRQLLTRSSPLPVALRAVRDGLRLSKSASRASKA